MDSGKRRSHGSDSKYGFATSVRTPKSNTIDMYASPPAESAEEMSLPPPPGKTGLTANGNVPSSTPNTSSSGSLTLQNGTSSSGKRSQSQPPNRISPPRNGTDGPPASLPNVPPKIDRQKKPSRRSGSSSNNNNSSKGNSLERHSHIRDMKMVNTKAFDYLQLVIKYIQHLSN